MPQSTCGAVRFKWHSFSRSGATSSKVPPPSVAARWPYATPCRIARSRTILPPCNFRVNGLLMLLFSYRFVSRWCRPDSGPVARNHHGEKGLSNGGQHHFGNPRPVQGGLKNLTPSMSSKLRKRSGTGNGNRGASEPRACSVLYEMPDSRQGLCLRQGQHGATAVTSVPQEKSWHRPATFRRRCRITVLPAFLLELSRLLLVFRSSGSLE